MIFEPLRIQQRTGESPRAREVPGFRLTKFHAVAAETEASRCSSGRLQWTAKIINSMRLIWGWQYLPLRALVMWEGWAVPPWALGNEGLRSTTGDFCFHTFPSSFSRCFSLLQSLFCPLGLVLQVPIVQRSWEQRLSQVLVHSLGQSVPLPTLGRHQSCCLNPMWFHRCDAEQPWEHLWLCF